MANYARESYVANQTTQPSFVPLPVATAAEKEALFSNLRERLDKPLFLWEAALLDHRQIGLLKNEIYARHGMKFKSANLDSWFRSFPWYQEDPGYSESRLTKVEKENAFLLNRLEFVKSSKTRTLLTMLSNPGVALKEISGERGPVSVAKGGLTFLSTGKSVKLSHKVMKDKDNVKLFTDFERAGMFDDLPLVFVQAWRTEHQVSGVTDAVGMKVFDTDGKELKNFTSVAGNLFYNKDIGAVISYWQGGCCGVSEGVTAIMDRDGAINFSSNFGREGEENGYLDYIKPYWGDHIFAWIRNELELSNGSVTGLSDRIAVIGKGGKPIIDFRLPSHTLDEVFGWSLEPRQLVQLTPEVVYAMLSNGSASGEGLEVLIYLGKPLPQKK
ncbi:YARHG domain-containing protein [Geomonas limicola]|nr:YARHG domain-containing protein [Geomonas limicola]